MGVLFPRAYNETEAKAAYLQKIADTASTQDLTEDVGPYTIRLSIVFTVIAALFVGLRFLTRWRWQAQFRWDDWFILASIIMLFANMAMNIVVVNQGLGKHAGALTLEQRQIIDRSLVGSEILYLTNVSLFKLSLLCLYVRVFPVRVVRLGARVFGTVAICWTIACVLAAIFQCTPRNKLWEPWRQGTCIDLFLTFLCVSVPNILCDLGILLLPIPQLWKLQTNLWQKILLTFIFLLGSYVVFTSAYRFRIYLLYRSDDIPYTLADGAAWNVIEISSGTVSACLPTLGPLVKFLFRPLWPSTRGGSGPANSTGNKGIITFGGSNKRHGSKGRNLDASLFSHAGREEDPGLTPYRTGITVSIGKRPNSDNNSSDEIPLNTIRQQVHVEWTEETHSGEHHVSMPKDSL